MILRTLDQILPPKHPVEQWKNTYMKFFGRVLEVFASRAYSFVLPFRIFICIKSRFLISEKSSWVLIEKNCVLTQDYEVVRLKSLVYYTQHAHA